MENGTYFAYIQSALVPLIAFALLLIFTMVRGRRAITSLILGLYFALLISLTFPYYTKLTSIAGGVMSDDILKIVLFGISTLVFSLLMNRLLFYRIDEGAFQSLPKKILLSLMATVLLMAFCYHALPISDMVSLGLPAKILFAPQNYFFGWLIAPLILLFFV